MQVTNYQVFQTIEILMGGEIPDFSIQKQKDFILNFLEKNNFLYEVVLFKKMTIKEFEDNYQTYLLFMANNKDLIIQQ